MKPRILITRLGELMERYDVLKRTLSDDDVATAEQYSDQRSRRFWMCRRGWLREQLAAKIHIEPSAIRFDYGQFGKPRVRGFDDIGFNATSSGPFAAIAIVHRAQVGIDIEEVRPFPDWGDVATQTLGADLTRQIGAYADEDRPRLFWRAWTQHEARAKLRGRGLGHQLATLANEELHHASHPKFELTLALVHANGDVGAAGGFGEAAHEIAVVGGAEPDGMDHATHEFVGFHEFLECSVDLFVG